jgi:hypothetical protein
MTSDAQILAPPGAAGGGVDPRRWLTLAILLLAAFMNAPGEAAPAPAERVTAQ